MALGFFSSEDTLTPESIERRRKMADALLTSSTSTAPEKSWTQGAARLVQALSGTIQNNRLDEADKANQTYSSQQLAKLLGGGGDSSPSSGSPTALSGATAPTAPGASGQASPGFGDAIAGIESGGRYDITGPVTKTGDKAYGKYQIMGANIPEWSQAALGRTVTPQEFLANPGLQDQVFQHRFGEYAKKYGPEGAARAWFAGEGGMNNLNATDQLGTKVGDYGKRFAAALGPGAGQPPMAAPQTAAAPPQALPGGATAYAPTDQKILGSVNVSPGPTPGSIQWGPTGPTPAAQAPAAGPAGPAAAPSPYGGLDQPQAVPDWKGMPAPQPGLGAPPQQMALNAAPPPPVPPQAIPPRPAPSPQQLAQAVQAPPQAPQGAPQGAQSQQQRQALAAAIMSDPRASPQVKQVAGAILTQSLGPQYDFQAVGDQFYRVNKRTGTYEPIAGVSKPMALSEGQRLVDPTTGREIAGPGTTANTPDQKNFEAAKKEGYPGTFNDWLTNIKRAGATTIDNKGEDQFSKTVGTKQAEMFSSLVDEGMAGKNELATVQQLRGQIDKLPGGFLGGAQQIANSYGIKLGPNASALEAADAILNKLTPAQRQGMPGAASDKDVAMFRGSLPKLSNTPAGNKIIMDTMEALAGQKVRQGQISTEVMTGAKTREQGMKELQALPDPFAALKEFQKGGTAAMPAAAGAPPAGTVMKGYRFKGGDPSNQTSWEKVN